MSTSPRILVLTAGFGEGHNAAARAVAAAFDDAAGADTALMIDAFALAAPRFNAAARAVYLRIINDVPRAWRHIYDWLGHPGRLERRMNLFRAEIAILEQLIDAERPVAICSTYPLYGFFLEEIAKKRGGVVPPFFSVVTDSISIHSMWWRPHSDGWFMPNQDSADILLRAGIDPCAVHVTGFPVPRFFGANASLLSPPPLTAENRPHVLQIINSGTLHAEATARRLLTETDWFITCAVGRDAKLSQRLAEIAQRRKAGSQILGWTDQIPRLLMTHHAVISKAGGATTQEAIAAQCPMIVSQIVPGQEEGNYELLRRHGIGALATDPSALLQTLRAAFADEGKIWREWREALRPLARPAAAAQIVRRVLEITAPSAPSFTQRETDSARLPQPTTP